MPKFSFSWRKLCVLLTAMGFCAPVLANRLTVAPESHLLFHLGADLILYLHIGGGALGILTGLAASLSKKGSVIHRKSGMVFFWSMALCYTIGALVAPFLETQQSTNFVAAVLALYLLFSGVSAAKRHQFMAGFQEKLGLVVASLITLLGAVFMYLTIQSPNGSMDGSPPQAYVLFLLVGGLAMIGDALAIKKGKLSNPVRIMRHLWRMSMSFFIASGSVFFGQIQFFPDWFAQSLLPIALGFFPIVIMVIYLGKFGYLKVKRA
jgi:hypothetical protein